MRTITNTFNLYHFDELSEKAQENAIETYRSDMTFAWQDEMIATIKAIADAMNCTYNYYSYDGISYDVSFEPCDFDDSLSGVRAWAFIENNFITPNEKPKTYWKDHCLYCDGRKNWSRKSKISYTLDGCPFTGYIADCCFAEAWEDWKKNFTVETKTHRGSTVGDFIDLVVEKLSKEWTSDNEYRYSDEGIIEVIGIHEYEFYEDGSMY